MENKKSQLEELFSLVDDEQSRFDHFHDLLKDLIRDDRPDLFKRLNGRTLFQAIVLNQRSDLLVSPFFAGVWSEIVDLMFVKKVASKHEDMLKDVREFEEWESSMNDVHKMARIGRLEGVVNLMKDGKRDFFKRDMYGYGVVYWAFVSGNVSMVDYVITLDIQEPSTNLESILMVLRRLKYAHLLANLKELSVRNSNQNHDFSDHCSEVNEKINHSTTQLYDQSSNSMKCSHSVPQKEISQSFQTKIFPSSKRNSPVLVKASCLIKHATLEQIKELVLTGKLDPNLRDPLGKSTLFKAVENSRLDIVEYLMSLPITWDETDNRHRNVFHVAAQHCNENMFSLLFDLITKKAGIIETLTLLNQKDKYVGSELCMLLKGKEGNQQAWFFVEVLRGLSHIFLVKSKQGGVFDVSKYGEVVMSGIGENPSHEDKRKVTEIYDKRKAIHMGFRKDQTPLHIAVYNGGVELVRQLIDKKAMIDCKDCFGMTPLHLAAVKGDKEICGILLDAYANTQLLDSVSKTAYEVARDNTHYDLARFISIAHYVQISKEVNRLLTDSAVTHFSEDVLEQNWSEHDIKKYLLSKMRDLVAEINSIRTKLENTEHS